MSAQTEPFIGLFFGWLLGESGYKEGMDANLQRIGALLQIGVKSKSLNIGDITPSESDRYIVPPGASGAWLGKENQLAYYRSGNWYFIAPRPGFSARVETPPGRWDFTAAGAWELQTVPEPGTGFDDAPNDGKRYFRQNGAWVEFTDTESFVQQVDISDATYTVQANDRGKVLNFTQACTVTVPAGLQLNTATYIRQGGAGTVTLQAGSGVTLWPSGDTHATRTQGSMGVVLINTATDATFSGDVT